MWYERLGHWRVGYDYHTVWCGIWYNRVGLGRVEYGTVVYCRAECNNF